MHSASSRLVALIQSWGIGFFLFAGTAHAAGPLLIAYGGFNETMAPLWVGIEKGAFKKLGLDVRVLQTRSGPIMMATLASGGVPLVWAAPSSALSATVGGMKMGCFAVGSNHEKLSAFLQMLLFINPNLPTALQSIARTGPGNVCIALPSEDPSALTS